MENQGLINSNSGEGTDLKRPIFIQGLLGSIQNNRITLKNDEKDKIENLEIKSSSCFFNSFLLSTD